MTYLVAAVGALVCSLDTLSAQSNSFTFAPTSLSFNATPGNSALGQNLSVGSAQPTPIGFSISSSIGTPGCNTINIVGFGSQTPTSGQVFANTASLTAGTYNCSLTFNPTTPGATSGTVPVTIVIGSGGGTSGQITAAPSALSLSAQTGTTPATATITLTNSNVSSPVVFSAAPTPSGSWLRITPTSGTVNSTQTISVQADPTGLAANTYTGSISITPQGSAPITIPVTFTVSGNPTLLIQQNGAPLNQTTGVTFYYETGKSLPGSQTLTFLSSSTTPINFSVSAASGSSFLVVTPSNVSLQAGQTTGTTISLAVASTAASLPPGIYQTTVNVSAGGASNPAISIPVKLVVSATPLLTTNTQALAVAYQIAGAAPAAQIIQVATTSTALPFSVTSDQPWLVVGPLSGTASQTTPANLTLTINTTNLVAGSYTGNVTISSPSASNSPIVIPVTLTVSGSTLLTAAPPSVTFIYQTGGTLPSSQTLNVGSTGVAIPFTASVSYPPALALPCPTNWLTLSQTTGTAGQPGTPITVSANPSGINPPANCMATISITSTGAPNAINIPVALDISATPLIMLNTQAINLSAQLNSTVQQTAAFSITATDGTTPLQFAISNPAPWLFVSPTTGTTPVNIQIQANPNAPGLVLGANTTTLTITSPSLNGGSISLPVTFNLTSGATISASPASLTFAQSTGGAAPATQTVNLTIAGASGASNFTATAASSFGNWLTVTPASGTLPGALTVSVNGSTLSQGTYTGTITVSVPGASNSPLTIPVTLTVTTPQSVTVSAPALTFTSAFGATQNPANQTLQVTSAGAPVPFSVSTSTTSCGPFLTATPAQATTPATITVGVNIANVPAATTCNGTITISGVGIQSQTVNVSLTVTAPAPPQLTNVVNGASFAPGAIAPGEIVTLFGVNIGPVTLTSYNITGGVFDTKVADTEVLFDGIPAPIIFVRADQVAVVVPFDLAGRLQTNVQVRRSGVLSNILQQRVVDAAPGIFTIPSGGSGQAAIANQNGTINSGTTPATRGTVVAIYITGAGQMTPRGVNGGLSGASPLSIIDAPVTVSIGGQPAVVQYKGGAPGNIQGLYQINAVVPQTGSGPQSVQVTVGGVPAQGNVTLAVQ